VNELHQLLAALVRIYNQRYPLDRISDVRVSRCTITIDARSEAERIECQPVLAFRELQQ
jgi:hypothetical protein